MDSLQCIKTAELYTSRQFPNYFISLERLTATDVRNAKAWPSVLYPTASARKICGRTMWKIGQRRARLLGFFCKAILESGSPSKGMSLVESHWN